MSVFAHEHASRYRVTVATSDGLEQIIIRGAGCILLSAREFEQEVKEKNRQLQAEYDSRKRPWKGLSAGSDAKPGA